MIGMRLSIGCTGGATIEPLPVTGVLIGRPIDGAIGWLKLGGGGIRLSITRPSNTGVRGSNVGTGGIVAGVRDSTGKMVVLTRGMALVGDVMIVGMLLVEMLPGGV